MATKARQNRSTHIFAILQALFVTFLWSTSWVFIKIGLDDIPPLTFAGLRYTLAFFILFPLFLRSEGMTTLYKLKGNEWKQLILLGTVYYALTHGAQFVSIAYLPAVTANLILGFTPVVVALLSVFFLAERPLNIQWIGVCIALCGVITYFYPIHLVAGTQIGFVAAVVGMLANAVSSIWGRSINRTRTLSPLLITTLSMGIGSIILLASGILLNGFPTLSLTSWLIVIWLALVNTAFAFTLWNHTLRTLSALESSLINNMMAVQIPILAVLFLGERLTLSEVIGLAIVIVGVLLVQIARALVRVSPLHKTSAD